MSYPTAEDSNNSQPGQEAEGQNSVAPDAREAALVGRASEGNADAFGELYLLHMDAIYRYVRFRVGTVADAEDLTEQVFLKAWEALPGYEQRGYRFRTWLYRIAHNAVVDFHRRARHVADSSMDERQDSLLDSQTVGWTGSGQTPRSVTDQVIDAEEIASLSAAIEKLGEEQQQVIVLRFIEGLSHADVAHIVNKSEGACRVIQHRALAALQRLLSDG